MESTLSTREPFVPPAPRPRTKPPSLLEMLRVLYRNPIEIWGEPSYREPWISIRTGVGGPLVIANDPGLVRHVLVDNVRNYRMGRLRQAVLRPILRDGLLTAEGEVWRRSRKAMAPVFTPRHIAGFAGAMQHGSQAFAARYADGAVTDVARDMTKLAYEILAETLFSGELAGIPDAELERQIDRLFATMARIDPFDILQLPAWLPRPTRVAGRRAIGFFRRTVANVTAARRAKLAAGAAPTADFLGLLLQAEGPDGLSAEEIADNILTFIGAGHETTARALAWTLFLLGSAPWERERVEAEIDGVVAEGVAPVDMLDAMPLTRAAFEEAMRLYPPAPTISREAIESDRYGELEIVAGAQVTIMPWTIHRHRKLWDRPDAFLPERFHPGNRDRIDRYQYLPFGAGPRICIGASFAMQEAMIALAALMSRWRFDPLPQTKPWPVQKLTVQPEGGIPMKVSAR
ncbi:MAG: cytochrome P450 [Rhizobiaceae bacterium]|nr:cytochrome P450 [Rhizobiaceae bacterium]